MNWSVYLGSRASGWSYRYRVSNGSVFCATRREAQHIVRTEFGRTFAAMNGIGTDSYHYATRADRTERNLDALRAVITNERLRRSMDIAEHGGAS